MKTKFFFKEVQVNPDSGVVTVLGSTRPLEKEIIEQEDPNTGEKFQLSMIKNTGVFFTAKFILKGPDNKPYDIDHPAYTYYNSFAQNQVVDGIHCNTDEEYFCMNQKTGVRSTRTLWAQPGNP